MTEIEKPPLGVMPRQIWLENCASELSRAVREYTQHFIGRTTHGEWLSVQQWCEELNRIAVALDAMSAEDVPF